MTDSAVDNAATPSHIIKRPRLTKILDETEARIILLCAPAGYGKTTLAREWIATRSEPVYWYAGGPAMADVAALAVDLAELFAGSESDRTALVRSLAARGESTRRISKELGAAGPRAGQIVVVDDYQFAERSSSSAELFGELVASSSFRLLLTTRDYPTWLEARRLVYGEVMALDATVLALTDTEAAAVLANADPTAAGAEWTVTNAHGWPALIGLAARRGTSANVERRLSPHELYEYVASELFFGISERDRTALFELALGGDCSRWVARDLLGANWAPLVEAAVGRGFAVRDGDGWISIHPLLRTFLLDKFEDSPESAVTAGRVIGVLQAHRKWDECLVALQRHPNADLAAAVLSDALTDLLQSGRIQTAESWIELARQQGFIHPIFDLASAEVALRRGRYARTLAVAANAARPLCGDLAARAYLAAARAAHQLDDAAATFAFARRAEEHAASPELQTEAIWIAAAKAYEADPSRLPQYCERLERVDDPRPDHALRVACAQACRLMSSRRSFRDAVSFAERGAELTADVDDPLLRTNALHTHAHLLRVCAEYDRALAAVELLEREAERMGLDFVLGHAAVVKAGALVGNRSLGRARDCLRRLESVESSPHETANLAVTRARLRIAIGDLDGALMLLNGAMPLPTLGLQAEFFGFRGLVRAALGRTNDALADIREAEEGDRGCFSEGAAYVTLTRAILNVADGAAPPVTASAIASVWGLGALDAIVMAARAYPQLAAAAVLGGARDQLEATLILSRDTDLGRRAGLAMPREIRRGDPLSPREVDVYELIVAGRTNAEIARTLFISHSTTKVHVQHILEKLGVHSRAEAAALAMRPRD